MTSLMFASQRLLREFGSLDPVLYHILWDMLDGRFPGDVARVTCIWRNQNEEQAAGGQSGIHTCGPPYRAVDIGGREFSQAQLDTLAIHMNALWKYDPARPEMVVCYVKPHGTGAHAHLQVHPNTRRRHEG